MLRTVRCLLLAGPGPHCTGSSSQPPEIFAAQKSKSANVGQWLDRLIAQSKKMHAELSASRREVAGMRGFIQNESALAGETVGSRPLDRPCLHRVPGERAPCSEGTVLQLHATLRCAP